MHRSGVLFKSIIVRGSKFPLLWFIWWVDVIRSSANFVSTKRWTDFLWAHHYGLRVEYVENVVLHLNIYDLYVKSSIKYTHVDLSYRLLYSIGTYPKQRSFPGLEIGLLRMNLSFDINRLSWNWLCWTLTKNRNVKTRVEWVEAFAVFFFFGLMMLSFISQLFRVVRVDSYDVQ